MTRNRIYVFFRRVIQNYLLCLWIQYEKCLVLHDYGSNVDKHSFNLYDNTWKKGPPLHRWSIADTT